jgi:hypothetical protein
VDEEVWKGYREPQDLEAGDEEKKWQIAQVQSPPEYLTLLCNPTALLPQSNNPAYSTHQNGSFYLFSSSPEFVLRMYSYKCL